MIRRWAWHLVGRVLSIGANPADSHDERAQKVFFVGVVAGVLPAGVMWNMASRMESHSAPDSIHLTRSTYELLGDEFATEPRGLVEVKGKGHVETWLLVGANGGRG